MIELIRQQTVIGWTLIKATFQILRRMNYGDAWQICNKGFVAWIVFPSFTGSQDRVPPMLNNTSSNMNQRHMKFVIIEPSVTIGDMHYLLYALCFLKFHHTGNYCIKQRTVETVVVIRLYTVPVEVDSVRLAITGERVHYSFRLHGIFAC